MNLDGVPIVIDNGSGNVKGGVAKPGGFITKTPSLVGLPKQHYVNLGMLESKIYTGKTTEEKRGLLNLSCPMKNGVVWNWDDMILIWRNLIEHELRVAPGSHPFLFTEAPLNPKANKQKMLVSVFESFNIPAANISIQGVLALYATGKTTGLVVESGDGVTVALPCYEGFAVQHAISRIDMGGSDVTEYLARLLTEEGYSFNTSGEKEIVRCIKEKACYVAPDPLESIDVFLKRRKFSPCKRLENPKQFELPDGNRLFLGMSSFKCGEAIFDPTVIGQDQPGIPEMIKSSVNRCEIDLRRVLYENLILNGGTTMFEGFIQRLFNEVSLLTPASVKVDITSPEDRINLVLRGGLILAQLSTFNHFCINREEYCEFGSSIINRRFLYNVCMYVASQKEAGVVPLHDIPSLQAHFHSRR